MMITVKSEIDATEALYTGHGIPRETLSGWLCDVDGYVASVILKLPEQPERYSYDESPDTPLLIQARPWRRVYSLYLGAMIDFSLKHFGDYSIEMSEYERIMRDYLHRVTVDGDNATRGER